MKFDFFLVEILILLLFLQLVMELNYFSESFNEANEYFPEEYYLFFVKIFSIEFHIVFFIQNSQNDLISNFDS